MFHPHYNKCSSCADKWTFNGDINGPFKSPFICHTIRLKGRSLTCNYECQALITVTQTFVNNVM